MVITEIDIYRLGQPQFSVLSRTQTRDDYLWFTTFDGLSSNFIRSIYGDREGSVWLGTLNRGIIRASRK